jgi:hypothetical protein
MDTLCSKPGSRISDMFSGNQVLKTVDGKIYINSDPKVFKYIITFLETNVLPDLEDSLDQLLLNAELKFWGLNGTNALHVKPAVISNVE